MLLRDSQATFGGGEFSPALWGRTDLQKYKSGLRTGRNINTLPQGGVRNRPGTAFVATAGDSTHAVRLIPFIASTNTAYIIELGNFYARFYTLDGQVQSILGGAYQIVTPYAAADLFQIRFAQSADVLYLSHPSYTPQTLTFNSNANWTMAAFSFVNGPFMVQNIVQANTLTVNAPAWITATAYTPGQYVLAGGLTAADLIDNFASGNYSLWTAPNATGLSVVNSRLTMTYSTSVAYWPCVYKALAQSYGSFTVRLGPSAGFLFGMSAATVDAQNFPASNGYGIYTSADGSSLFVYRMDGGGSGSGGFLNDLLNGTVTILKTISGLTPGEHLVTIFRHSADGVTTVYVDGAQQPNFTDNTYNAGAYIFLVGMFTGNLAPGRTIVSTATDIYYDAANTAQNTAPPVNYVCLLAHVSGTFATDLAAGDWRKALVVAGNGVSLVSTLSQFQAGHVNSLWQVVQTLSAQTISDSGFTAINHATTPILCGPTYSVITLGTWTGKLLIQTSVDGGFTWSTIQTLQSNNVSNFNVSGSTGFSQGQVRVSSDPSVSWSGTAIVSLTANSFDYTGVVQITAVTNGFNAVGNVYAPVNAAGGAAVNPSTQATTTWEWSEGSWSSVRGFPSCVTFYQDRSSWGSTLAEPNTEWNSKTSSYADFGVSQPLQDDDAFDVVLASRQLNRINFLVPMPQAMIAGAGDMAFGIAPGSNGLFSASSVQQTPMDHRGNYNLDPVVVGNEIILIQQMGTVVRNLIFQLAVNGFMGDNLSVASQHLFTGYTIIQMAYQQEPDSIIWAVRNDGQLLSCSYDRAQEMNAWTHHDTQGGLFESVACIPNPTLGINEVWFVINRGGTRFIEVLKPRDQGTVPSAQWFVDCGTQYNGTPATVISGIPLANGTRVAVLADGFVVANGVTENTPILVQGGSITLPNPASVVTVGIPITWDVGLLDIESQNPGGTLQGKRVTQPRAKIRCWNSRSGYISTTDPASSTGLLDTQGRTFDALFDIMQRDPSVNMDTPLPLISGIVDSTPPNGYSYGSHICLRGIDPLPFTLLDVISEVVPGGP